MNIHIINHTHWDREWFLSSIYTTHWIPRLIDKLIEISKTNPNFRYLFDGQTLVIEDLLKEYPDYRPKVEQLIRNGNLTIGPYYCQPDWKLTCGELLMRNFEYGRKDADALGGTTDVGWLVDTFGHISQSPQIHAQNGIEAVYVWRGMPEITPYFDWQGADGTKIFGINLFGGYRNLYGVTHVPEVAEKRLISEVEKLAPYYPTPDMPLFDGYDLEDNPEDPITFFTEHRTPNTEYHLLEATPKSFVEAIRPKLSALPTLNNELNSGKYGATFPGTYSARTYLKVMSRAANHLLFQVAEPLAVLARLLGREYDVAMYEQDSRLLLQNAVHDCICGVSIDQVHEKMEDIYKKVARRAEEDADASLNVILRHFAAGDYAVSTNPFPTKRMVRLDNHIYEVETNGIGVWKLPPPVVCEEVVESAENHTFQNDHFTLTVDADGIIHHNDQRLGYLAVSHDKGDTYSNQKGDFIGILKPQTQLYVTHAGNTTAIKYRTRLSNDTICAEAIVTITLDEDALIHWQIDLLTAGTDLRVDFVVETGLNERVYAGMPFDVVARPFSDSDLLPLDVDDPQFGKILLGQRESGEVSVFPFHDFVATTDGTNSAVVFSNSVHSYEAQHDGTLAITLQRSVEWLTRGNLPDRVGDAGPFFYVPDARAERHVTHKLAFAFGTFSPDSIEVQRLNAAFQNPPLIIQNNNDGERTEWQWLTAELPMSSLRVIDGEIVGRFYNPTMASGVVNGEKIRPKQIKSLTFDDSLPEVALTVTNDDCVFSVKTPRLFPVADNRSVPSAEGLVELERLIATSEAGMKSAEKKVAASEGDDRHIFQREIYVHHREMLEYQLSHRLNTLKLAQNGEVTDAYLYEPDPVVAEIGYQLNQLRIKRRIYDYVVAAL